MISFPFTKPQLKKYCSSLFYYFIKGKSQSVSTHKQRYYQYIHHAHSINFPHPNIPKQGIIQHQDNLGASQPIQLARQLYQQAEQLYNNQKLIQAMRNLHKSIQINHSFQQAFFLMGNIMLQQSQYQQAIRFYQQVIMINPNNSDAYNNAGIAFKQLGQNLEALRAFQASFCINDQDYKTSNNLGVMYLLCLENVEQAAKYIWNASQLDQSGFQQYLDSGEQLYHQQKYFQSTTFLMNAFFRNTEHQITAKLLKNCFLLGDKTREGRELYDWLIKKGIVNYNVYSSYGSLLFQLGEIDQSKQYLEKAMQLNNRSYDVNLYLATVYTKQGKKQKAVKHYQTCIEIQPHNYIAYSSSAIVYMQMNDFTKAHSAFIKAIDLNPRDSMALSGLGSILLMKRQFQEGMKYLKLAIEIDPKNYAALQKIGTTLYVLGKEQQGNHYLGLARAVQKQNKNFSAY